MRVQFDTKELYRIVTALEHARQLYLKMARLERNDLDRKNVEGYAAAASALAHRFAEEEEHPDLTPGEVAVLERALRFETSRWQQQIKPTAPAYEKKALLESADKVASIITKLRQARGLDFNQA